MTSYPFKIDTNLSIPAAIDNVSPIKAIYFNNLRNCCIAMQGELGVKPSGTYGTIRARLDYIDVLFQNLNAVTLGKDLGGSTTETLVIGIQGNPVSNITPQIGNALLWNGLAWIPQDPGPLNENLEQTEWHIDPINGSDSASGSNSGAPIKTVAEYIRRCGLNRYLSFDISFYIYNDLSESDPIISTFDTSSTGTINIIGENLTVLRSGTLGTYRAFNAGTKTPPGITDNSGSINWTPYVGKLVKITSGTYATKNAYFWIAKDEGGGIARISFPKYRDPSNTFAEASFVPQAGDTYQILELRKASIQISINGAFNNNRFTCLVERFAPIGGPFTNNSGYTVNQSAFTVYWWCDFAFLTTDAALTNCNVCRFSGIIGTLAALNASSCLFQTIDFQIKGTLFLGGDTFVQASSRPRFHYAGESGIYCDSPAGHLAIFDCGLWFFIDQGAIVELKTNIWGTGNTGALIQIHSGMFYDKITSFNYASTVNNNGTYGNGTYDFILMNKTTGLAIDPGTLQRIFPPKDLTFSNLRATVSAGGFGGSITDPYTLMGIVSGNSESTYSNNKKIAQQQSFWFIDSINGSDNNDGYTSLTALKTAEELHRRVGPIYEISNNVTITLLENLLTTDTLHLENIVPTGTAKLIVKGIEKVVASGTFTDVRQFDHVNNIQWGVKSTDIGSFAPHIKTGRYIRKTSGTHAGIAGFWPAKDEDGTMCRVSQPAYRPANDFFNCFTESLNIGDTFNIVDFPQITNVTFGGYHPASALGSVIYLENVAFVGFPIAYSATIAGREVSFAKVAVQSGGVMNFANSQVGGDTLGFNLYVIAYGHFDMTYGIILNSRINFAGILGLSNYTLLQGSVTWTSAAMDGSAAAGIECHTRGFGIYDSPGSGLIVAPWHENFIAGTIWGSGNDGYGIEIMPGGKMVVGGLGATAGGFFIIQGNQGDIKVGGKAIGPAINTTNPYGYTEDRVYSHANFNASVASGGFGEKIVDPLRPGSGIFPDH